MDRRLFIHIQGGRQVSGVLRGYDMFLNLVVDQAYEELGGGERKPAGMVVSTLSSILSSHLGHDVPALEISLVLPGSES